MFTLVVMAAGVGRRFGGDKQLVSVGPHGETFLDYAVAAAAAAGAAKVVLVVRAEIEAAVRSHVSDRPSGLIDAGVEFAYVRQDGHGPARAKPWGTAHAVLVAADEVAGPFVVCNADDYYGASTMAAIGSAAARLQPDEALLSVHRLGRTLSDTGAVSRGVCHLSGDRLVAIVEHHGVARRPDGTVAATEPPTELGEDDFVSMNLWAFSPAAFEWIEASFERFLAENRDDAGAECLLPAVVGDRLEQGLLSVGVVPTDEAWIGVTNADDLAAARSALAERATQPHPTPSRP